MADQYFTNDILTLILKHLPSKTLIKFLTISKSWYTLITSPNFISTHLRYQSYHNHQNHMLFNLESNYHFSVCNHIQNISSGTPLTFPVNTIATRFGSVCGTCNGVVCLFNGHDRSLCLYNPSINKHLFLDPLSFLALFPVIGFGFDSKSNDYKVVAIDYQDKYPQALFYSLKNRTWNKVELFPGGLNMDIYLSNRCFVDGAIHWIMFNVVDDDEFVPDHYAASVLTFDLCEDVFGEFGLPDGLSGAVNADLDLAVIDGLLGMLYFVSEERDCVIVWQMKKEDVWTVLYKIKLDILDFGGLCGGYWEGKSVVVTSCGLLIVLDKGSSRGERVFISGQTFSYTESLIFLDKFSDRSWMNKAITS